MSFTKKVPESWNEQWSGADFVPPWKEAVDESARRAALVRRAALFNPVAVGFAAGAVFGFAPVPLVLKPIVVALLLVAALYFRVAAARSLSKAFELQQQAMAGGIKLVEPKEETAEAKVEVAVEPAKE